jgi:hypothetical protein
VPLDGRLPRRRPEPLELPPDIEFPPEDPELEGADDVDEVPPEDEDDPDEDEPEGTALPVETEPAGAECCACTAGATARAIMPVRAAARG